MRQRDTSISSVKGAGDDEGQGRRRHVFCSKVMVSVEALGQVVLDGGSRLPSMPPIMLAVKSARRGVGKWGLATHRSQQIGDT